MGSKAIRRPPKEFIEWLTKKGGKAFADWYVKEYGKAKTARSAESQRMSRKAGTTGAYHDGHMRGASDVHPQFGGGPTSALSMFPEIGAVNVAHKELPRIPYENMREGGVPQNWFEDVYEQYLESMGLGVIGKYDTQAAMDMDAGMDPGQARAQADRRRQLRAQGVNVGPDTDPRFAPAPTPEGNDVPLPNLADAMDAARERENRQIANRRSVRAKNQSKALELYRQQTNAIMTGYQPTALGGFVFGQQNNQRTMPQTPYTPPTQGGYVHRNKGPSETPPVGGENLAQQIFSAENMEAVTDTLQKGAVIGTAVIGAFAATARDLMFGSQF